MLLDRRTRVHAAGVHTRSTPEGSTDHPPNRSEARGLTSSQDITGCTVGHDAGQAEGGGGGGVLTDNGRSMPGEEERTSLHKFEQDNIWRYGTLTSVSMQRLWIYCR